MPDRTPLTTPGYLQKEESKWDEPWDFLFWSEMKINTMTLNSDTRQENFSTFKEREIFNGIKSH